MKSTNKFSFLASTRFWVIVVGALAIYLQSKGILGEAEMQLIATVSGLFVTVRTIDRATEQKVLAASVASGQVSAEDATDIPPQE